MKKVKIIMVLILFSTRLLSQEESKNIEVKLYGNYTPMAVGYRVSNSHDSISNISLKGQYSPFAFSPAIVIKKNNGNSSEFVLSRFIFLKGAQLKGKVNNISDSTLVSQSKFSENLFDLQLRYEYKFLILKNKEIRKLMPFIGVSVSPFITQYKINPLISSSFPKQGTTLGVYISTIPRLEYNINEKVYLDFNVPLSFVSYTYSINREGNPVVPIEERKKMTSNFETALKFSVRLGIGVKI